jgi:hypothetical protein
VFEGHFGDGEEARGWWEQYRTRAPYIYPRNDPTIEQVQKDWLKWVRMLYNMMTNQDDVRDNTTGWRYDKFVRLIGSSFGTEAACHELVVILFLLLTCYHTPSSNNGIA